ncbi:hypothetical protein GGF31_004845 [Allomyces arbusculus]|nr:hypothetical protein GGF31_004845 [Allomyces arbusculus]
MAMATSSAASRPPPHHQYSHQHYGGAAASASPSAPLMTTTMVVAASNSSSSSNLPGGHTMQPMPTMTMAMTAAPSTGRRSTGRIAQACIVCRKKKTKCSGERPSCRYCLDSGFPCSYAAPKRRGPPRKMPALLPSDKALGPGATSSAAVPGMPLAPANTAAHSLLLPPVGAIAAPAYGTGMSSTTSHGGAAYRGGAAAQMPPQQHPSVPAWTPSLPPSAPAAASASASAAPRPPTLAHAGSASAQGLLPVRLGYAPAAAGPVHEFPPPPPSASTHRHVPALPPRYHPYAPDATTQHAPAHAAWPHLTISPTSAAAAVVGHGASSTAVAAAATNPTGSTRSAPWWMHASVPASLRPTTRRDRRAHMLDRVMYLMAIEDRDVKNLRQVGASAGFHALRNDREFARFFHHGALLVDQPEAVPGALDAPPESVLDAVDPDALPPPNVQLALQTYFFHHVYPLFPICDFDQWSYYVRDPERRFLFEQHSLYALASAWYQRTRQPALAGWESPAIHARRAKMWLHRTLSSAPTLSRSCGLAMLALAEAGDHTGAAWTLAGMAIRIAQDIGLHVDLAPFPHHVHFGPRQLARARSVWWCCYVLDRLLAVTLGRPVAVRDDEMGMPLPDEDEDETDPDDPDGGARTEERTSAQDTTWRMPSGSPAGVLSGQSPAHERAAVRDFAWHARLAQLQGWIITVQNRIRAGADSDAIGAQLAALDAWRAALPTHLAHPGPAAPLAHHLSILFHTTVLTCLRPLVEVGDADAAARAATSVHELVAALAAAHAAGVLLGLSIAVVHAVETAALLAYAVAHVGHAAAAAAASAHLAHWARVIAATWPAARAAVRLVDRVNEVVAAVVGGGGGTVAPAAEGDDGDEYDDGEDEEVEYEDEEDVDMDGGDEEEQEVESGDEYGGTGVPARIQQRARSPWTPLQLAAEHGTSEGGAAPPPPPPPPVATVSPSRIW